MLNLNTRILRRSFRDVIAPSNTIKVREPPSGINIAYYLYMYLCIKISAVSTEAKLGNTTTYLAYLLSLSIRYFSNDVLFKLS